MSQRELTAHAHRPYNSGILLHLNYFMGTERKFIYSIWLHLNCYCSTPYFIRLVLSLGLIK